MINAEQLYYETHYFIVFSEQLINFFNATLVTTVIKYLETNSVSKFTIYITILF